MKKEVKWFNQGGLRNQTACIQIQIAPLPRVLAQLELVILW